MSRIKAGSDAGAFVHRTGLDRLPESAKKLVDKDGDGLISLKEALKVAKKAGLDGDGRLDTKERARVRTVLGETRGQRLPAKPISGGIQSILSARAEGADRRLPEGYMERKIEARADGLTVHIEFTEYDRSGDAKPEKCGKAFIPGLVVNGYDGEFYGKDGNTGIAGYESSKFAAGLLVGVADEHLGVVLVDVTGKDAVKDKEPNMTALLDPKNLASRAAIKAAAKKAGLSTRGLSVSVTDVKLSGGGYEDKHTMTLGFELTLTDGRGKSKKGLEFSTTLTGDPSRGLGDMQLGRVESGLEGRAGWLYPPSMLDDEPRTTNSDRGRTDDSGASTYTPPTRRTGGGEGSYRNWGGSYGGSSRSGGGE